MRNWFRKYFVPNEENGYKPHVLQRLAAGLMLFLIVCSFTVANIQTLIMVGSDWFVSTILPAILVDLTNENRTERSLGTLRRSALLDEAAKRKAEDMAENGYFAHHSPDGLSPWYWFDQVGYTYLHAGENLAVHFTESDEVVEAWMESPGHRANILNSNYTEIGIGTAEGEYKGFPTIFVVQLFGTPSALAVAEPEAETVNPPAPADTEEPPPPSESDLVTEPEPEPEATEGDQQTEDLIIAGDFTDGEVTPTTSEDVTLPTTTLAEMVEEADEEAEVLVLYSDIATSTPLAYTTDLSTGSAGGTAESTAREVGPVLRVLTTPSLWLSWLYVVLGTFIFVSLILSIVIEWRRQHPVQIAYGAGLIALLAIMINVHEALVGGALIL